jgi:hypothetical protein
MSAGTHDDVTVKVSPPLYGAQGAHSGHFVGEPRAAKHGSHSTSALDPSRVASHVKHKSAAPDVLRPELMYQDRCARALVHVL